MANAFFKAGRCIKTHRQQVPKACHPSAEHRRPRFRQDEHFLPSCCTVYDTRHPAPGDPLQICREVSSAGLPTSWVSSSRKHGLATFVRERLKWTLFDQSLPTLETEWLCIDIDGYKLVNVYKPPPIRLQVSNLPVFPHPCLYAGDFNCQDVDWGYDINIADGECLVGWASANNLALLHNPKDAASFPSGRWNTNINPDLAFVGIYSTVVYLIGMSWKSSQGLNFDLRLLGLLDLYPGV